jgi:hypothetical protein
VLQFLHGCTMCVVLFLSSGCSNGREVLLSLAVKIHCGKIEARSSKQFVLYWKFPVVCEFECKLCLFYWMCICGIPSPFSSK